VTAWTIGEHGELAVPLLDRVEVDGAPVTLSASEARAAREFVAGWYVRHVALDSGRSSTWTSGLGIARMVAACAPEARAELWPASVELQGEYGLREVSLGVPVMLGPGGAREVQEWPLTDEQRASLHAGAALVRDAAERLIDRSDLDGTLGPG
jgi:malate dehydrogenase